MAAQCPICMRFVKAIDPKPIGEGYSYTLVAQGECSRCGVVTVDWDMAYGDWDPEF